MTPTVTTTVTEPAPQVTVQTFAAMYDPANLKIYPGIDLSRFGMNPFRKPMYRLTFASSVVHQVAYRGDNGQWKWEWRPRYRLLTGGDDQWILEEWRSAWEFHGMGRAQWERDCPNLPFYPEGVYEHCHTFEACTPTDANLDKLIMWIREGRNRSVQEIGDACRAEYAAETKATGDEIGARIRNCLPAYGTVAISGRVSRGTKTGATKRSAEEMARRGFVVADERAMETPAPVGEGRSKVVSGGRSLKAPEGSWKVPVEI